MTEFLLYTIFSLFHDLSKSLKIKMVLSFCQNFFEFLKGKKCTLILKILKISGKSTGGISVFEAIQVQKCVVEFYTNLFKNLLEITTEATCLERSNLLQQSRFPSLVRA